MFLDYDASDITLQIFSQNPKNADPGPMPSSFSLSVIQPVTDLLESPCFFDGFFFPFAPPIPF